MKLSHFSYVLPEELLAKRPAQNRDESRLMVVHRETGKIEHKMFKDLTDYFDDQDVMILNNTKVFPARMYGNKEKTGARIKRISSFLQSLLYRSHFLYCILQFLYALIYKAKHRYLMLYRCRMLD